MKQSGEQSEGTTRTVSATEMKPVISRCYGALRASDLKCHHHRTSSVYMYVLMLLYSDLSRAQGSPQHVCKCVQLLKPKMKTLNLSWHFSDSRLSSCLLTLTVTSVKVFTIAEFGHYWWQLSRQRVLTGHSCDISHPLSLLTFFFPFSSFQMDTAAAEKSIYGHWVPIWSFKNRNEVGAWASRQLDAPQNAFNVRSDI